ncbi:TPA: hypothetical protein ENX78_17895 [Candidatus Poribacteria bacterium]|nr:hypothetical protein [Candidatus Poribacteria bacterium]
MSVSSNQQFNFKKAFITYDALLSIMPIMFLIVFIIQVMAYINNDAIYTLQKRELFNFLVAAADYTVKKSDAVAVDSLGNLQPNLIDGSKLSSVNANISTGVSKFKIDISLSNLKDEPPNDQTCVYRLVVNSSNNKEIKKLYVCGEYANS